MICWIGLITLSVGLWGSGVPVAVFAQEYVPPVEGLPGRRQGGGTRGDCLHGDAPLIALMPDTNFGQTLDEYPTFYWYIPDVPAEGAEFVLLDEQDNEVYVADYQLSGQPGLIRLSLPDQAGLPPLEVGQNYRWYFSLICDRLDRSGDLFTEGWVRRIEDPDLTEQAADLSEGDRAVLYAESGIWYDTLNILAQMRRAQPDSLAIHESWSIFLDSVGLTDYVDEPFIDLVEEAH
jgi:hypothetical protein